MACGRHTVGGCPQYQRGTGAIAQSRMLRTVGESGLWRVHRPMRSRQASGISPMRVVPPPGGLSMCKRPPRASTRSASPRNPRPSPTSAPPTPSHTTIRKHLSVWAMRTLASVARGRKGSSFARGLFPSGVLRRRGDYAPGAAARRRRLPRCARETPRAARERPRWRVHQRQTRRSRRRPHLYRVGRRTVVRSTPRSRAPTACRPP